MRTMLKKNLLKFILLLLFVPQYLHGQNHFTIRDDGVVLLNNQPFFPYGFYTDEKTDRVAMLNHVRITGQAGFNVVHLERIDNAALPEIFSEAESNNQFIIYGPYKAIRLPALHAVYDRLKNQPSLMGYNIADDMQDGTMLGYPSNVNDVKELHDDLKIYDPRHLTIVSLGGSGGQTDVFSTRRFDAASEQIYPINGGSEINLVYKSALQIVENSKRWKQSPWLALQTFNWASNSQQRMPTFPEYYNMLYQSIVAGAKGLLLYSYHVGTNGCDSDPDLWNGIKTTPAEIELIRLFLTDGQITKTELGVGLYAATWEYNNQVLAIVVNAGTYRSYLNPANNAPDTRTVSLALPQGISGNAIPAFINRPNTMNVVNGRLEGQIRLLEVQAFFINKQPLPTALANFRTTHGLATNGIEDLATPAGDGTTNLLKFAFNMIGGSVGQASSLSSPNATVLLANGSAGLPRVSTDGTGKLQLTHIRRKVASNSGITYAVEFSSTLAAGSWAVNDAATTSVTSIDATFERVTVTDSSAAGKRFARVKITTP